MSDEESYGEETDRNSETEEICKDEQSSESSEETSGSEEEKPAQVREKEDSGMRSEMIGLSEKKVNKTKANKIKKRGSRKIKIDPQNCTATENRLHEKLEETTRKLKNVTKSRNRYVL